MGFVFKHTLKNCHLTPKQLPFLMKNILTLTVIYLLVLTSMKGQQMPDLLNVDSAQLTPIQPKMLARKQIKELKDGVLIFRLKTNDKALKKLENILNNPATSERSKQRIRKKTIPNLKSVTTELNKKIIRAFEEAYTFSDVYFMPDTCTKSLQSNDNVTCLTDATGKAVSGEVLNGKNIFLADYGTLSNDKTSSITGLIISDKASNTLLPPFPYFKRSAGFFAKLSSKNLTQISATKMITKHNFSLKQFFNE